MPKLVGSLSTPNLGSDPSATTGTLYFNTTSNQLRYRSGSSWVDIGYQTPVEPAIGSIIAWADSINNRPSNWEPCSGGEISRSTYSSLFDIIGTRFGSGNGSTTFNLPDFRGATLVMRPSTHANVAVQDVSGGLTWIQGTADPFSALTHTTDGASHTHTWTDSTSGSHTHTADHSHTTTLSSTGSDGDHGHSYTASTSSDGHTHTVGSLATFTAATTTTATAGANDSASGSHTHTGGSTATGNAHSHTVSSESYSTISSHSTAHSFSPTSGSFSGSSASGGSHDHGGTLTSPSSGHTHNDHDPKRGRIWYLIRVL